MQQTITLITSLLLAPSSAMAAEAISPARIHAPSKATPISTAAKNLGDFFKSQGVEVPVLTEVAESDPPAAGTIVLGTTADSAVLARWAKEGRLGVTAAEPAGDAYEIAVLDSVIVVNGANARSVLYGVFELEDVIARPGGVPADLARRAKPSLGLRLLHPRVQGGFQGYRKSDFEFLARCGGNVAHLTHDWMKEKTLFSFVPSTEFSEAEDSQALEHNRDPAPPVSRLVQALRPRGGDVAVRNPLSGRAVDAGAGPPSLPRPLSRRVPLRYRYLSGQAALPRTSARGAGVSAHDASVPHGLFRHLDVPRVHAGLEWRVL